MNQNKETLNWKQYFKNQNLLTDALKFKDWDQVNLEIPEQTTLIKDLTRTRNDDPFFKKESTQNNLKLLATFYCQQNNVNYQQGMLEVVVPFLLLKNKEFPLAKCYAYFNSFMNLFFPKLLEQKAYGKNKELAHVLSAIQFSEILLKYHCADFYHKLMSIPEFNVSMVITQWIMTLFAKGTPINIVFVIFDQFMQRNNPNYIFYLVSALFETKRQDIERICKEDPDSILPYLNKNIKTLQTDEDVFQLFGVADKQYSQTPKSYDQIIQQTSFHDNTVLSIEEVKELINFGDNSLSKSLFIVPSEVLALCGKSANKPEKNINLVVIDIRQDKKAKLKSLINKSQIIKDIKQLQQDTHYCILNDSSQSMQASLEFADKLVMSGVKYISIVQGGFEELCKLHKNPKQDGCCVM